MTRIFDNIEANLGPHLLETFETSDRIDAAVGYFNLRGWSTFAAAVDNRDVGSQPVMRIMVGMTLADEGREVLQALQQDVDGTGDEGGIDREIAIARRAEALLQFRTQLMRGIPSNHDLRILRQLRQHLSDSRVKIKLFTRRPMHGKAYLCHKHDPNSPIVGFVGSSNLTMAGLKHNYELNVDVLEYEGAKKLGRWFEDRWDDRFCIDITEDLIELIDESWAAETTPTPYELYLKVCYHLSREVREGLLEYSLPPELRGLLLEYQVNAVQTLSRRIQQRGGTMLGDVVGLGKTLTAIATALVMRETHGYSTLVLSPVNLTRMWKEHMDAYDVPGEVMSYSVAHRDLPDLRRYQLVILDESHNLRNHKRRDYKAIQDYIERNDSKVLLLTATPYNVRFMDVANQLSLYINDDQDLGLEPREAIKQNPKLPEQVDFRTNTMLAFKKSEEPEDWKNLMSEHLVRRTRSFVKTSYGKLDPIKDREYLEFPNGHRFYFPTRTPRPIDHSFGADDPAALISSSKTLDMINEMKLPRYSLFSYVDPKATLTGEEDELKKKWERAKGRLIGITRTHFYKRLSSCGYAYDVSLRRHLARNEMWLYAFANNLTLPAGTVLDSMFSSLENDEETDEEAIPLVGGQADYEALKTRASEKVVWVRPDLFTARIVADLEQDCRTIRDLLAQYGEWTADRDSKLAALVELLSNNHRDEKVLIFTEYKDTADYVARSLDAAGVDRVGLVSGDTEDPTTTVRNFAPESNHKPHEEAIAVPMDKQIRILVATDVLSEGQNLQDAHIVVNYDLPWAIIRLIQRAGRVDRVGQQAEEILIYSFFHESVENVILLRDRIRYRLAANAQAFGSDEVFFGTADEIQELHDLYNGKMRDGEQDMDVDASSLAFEVWSRAEEETPELAERVKHMPDLVFSTRAAMPQGEADGVACYTRTENEYDSFGFAEATGDIRMLTGHQALGIFRAEPADLALEMRGDHFDLTKKLVHGPLRRGNAVEGKLRGIRRQVWNRLSGKMGLAPEVSAALDALYRRPLQREAERRLQQRIRNRPSDDDLGDLLALLHRDEKLVISDVAGADPTRIVCTLGVTHQ